MNEYLVTRIGRNTVKTRLSVHAASNLRCILRRHCIGVIASSAVLDANCIGLTDSTDEMEVYDLSVRSNNQ